MTTEEQIEKILEIMRYIKEHMITKDDLASFRNDFREGSSGFKDEIVSFRTELHEFRLECREQFESIRKEIRGTN